VSRSQLGGHIPDTPFFDSREPWESIPGTYIFSLGSIIHFIMSGYWPFGEGAPPTSVDNFDSYRGEIDRSLAKRILSRRIPAEKWQRDQGLVGPLISDCWKSIGSSQVGG
jgi:hypothetical protein